VKTRGAKETPIPDRVFLKRGQKEDLAEAERAIWPEITNHYKTQLVGGKHIWIE
jgi:hypothetical protein